MINQITLHLSYLSRIALNVHDLPNQCVFSVAAPKSVSKLFVKSHSTDAFMIYQNTEYLQIYTSMIW